MDHNGMPTSAVIKRLSAIPWCRTLLESPEWTSIRFRSRVPKASAKDSYFAETLKTQRTIRSCTALRPIGESKRGKDGIYVDELRILFELGNGVNGWLKIAHGGFVVTMLDEAMGLLLSHNVEVRFSKGIQTYDGIGIFTAYLNTTYKKPVPTPSTVLCTVKILRRERNKIYLRATIEDGEGTVFTTAEGMFVETGSKL
ncbi:hypothetical protein BU23DRAFT_549960 [Bimuria novae-zelandiae CBS 107.79]|uniref:Thioesterase domain-containing protein n=1 Tax=Bimuria novae-zelandiae CBS 107.79 TaxID=1447943 RepID=A0A6A5VLC9_9PLEO|nr:hypothetical protein BU23DRAFT_549960 [Bimuria novae-zelandiae CBS 107.79]